MSDVVPEKKPISEKRRLANIANAQKSTGPRTQAGKDICKWNGTKHGMRSEHAVIPGESQEHYDALLAAHVEEWGAETPLQLYHIQRAVKASMKLERGDRVEEALTDKLMDAAAKKDADQDAAELERLTAQLAADPAGTMRQLRKTTAGCLWIRGQWLILQKYIANRNCLLSSQRRLSISLLGKYIYDIYRDDPVVTRWVVAHLGTLFGDLKEVDPDRVLKNVPGPIPPMAASELEVRIQELIKSLPDVRQSRLLLQGYIAEELSRLDEHMAFVAEVTARDRARDVVAAQVALTPDGKQLLGYIKAQDQAYDASLRRLKAVQDPRRPRPSRGPGPIAGNSPAQNEPAAATVEPRASESAPTATGAPAAACVAVATVATEAGPAVAAEAASSEREPLVGTTAESEPMTEPEAAAEMPIEAEGDPQTTRPIGADELTIEPEASPETTGPDWSDETIIELDDDPWTTRPIGADDTTVELEDDPWTTRPIGEGMTREERKRLRESMGPLDKTEQALVDYMKEKLRKVNEELDAKESQARVRMAAERAARGGRGLAAVKPDDAADAGAARSPPGGSTRDG